MIQSKLKGMGVAFITPFKADDSVDYDAIVRLIDYQISNGIDFLVIMATTAETPTLSEDEKLKIREVVVDRVQCRVPIVLGVGSNNTRIAVEQLKKDEFKGIDAILSTVPSYNKPNQEGLYQHFKAVSEASPLPIVLYNVPGRTGTNMTAETTLRLANEFHNIIAIKEASGNMSQIDEILRKKPVAFQVLSGDDSLTYPLMTLGAVGVVSVLGNAFPKEMSKMTHLILEGDYNNARIIHHQYSDLFKLIFVDGSPAGIKSILNTMGLCENKLRLPLVPIRAEIYIKIREALHKLHVKC